VSPEILLARSPLGKPPLRPLKPLETTEEELLDWRIPELDPNAYLFETATTDELRIKAKTIKA